jgi:hypothetical protein
MSFLATSTWRSVWRLPARPPRDQVGRFPEARATPSRLAVFAARFLTWSPVSYGSLQFFNSFSLSPLFQDSSCDLYSDEHVYETQCGLSTKEKTRFSASLRRGSPPLGTPVPASIRELESLQPVKTMKPFCARLSGHWTLKKSLCSSCRRDGRKHVFLRLMSLWCRLYRNRKPRGRLRCYRSSSCYGRGPRANLARGGCEASSTRRAFSCSRQPRLSLIDGDRLFLSQFSAIMLALHLWDIFLFVLSYSPSLFPYALCFPSCSFPVHKPCNTFDTPNSSCYEDLFRASETASNGTIARSSLASATDLKGTRHIVLRVVRVQTAFGECESFQ